EDLQVPVRLGYHRQLLHHHRDLRSWEAIISFIVFEAGIDPVPDASEACHGMTRLQCLGQHRACGSAHGGSIGGHAGRLGGLCKQHELLDGAANQDEVRFERRGGQWRIQSHAKGSWRRGIFGMSSSVMYWMPIIVWITAFNSSAT